MSSIPTRTTSHMSSGRRSAYVVLRSTMMMTLNRASASSYGGWRWVVRESCLVGGGECVVANNEIGDRMIGDSRFRVFAKQYLFILRSVNLIAENRVDESLGRGEVHPCDHDIFEYAQGDEPMVCALLYVIGGCVEGGGRERGGRDAGQVVTSSMQVLGFMGRRTRLRGSIGVR